MFLLLLIIVSIVTVLLFRRFIKKEDTNPFNLVAGVCLVVSWLVIVIWFTSRIEAWQLALNTPAANSDSIPAWSRTILNSLRAAVYLHRAHPAGHNPAHTSSSHRNRYPYANAQHSTKPTHSSTVRVVHANCHAFANHAAHCHPFANHPAACSD